MGVLAHGTTVATNALLERRGARTALVTTEGFRDVIEIGRQDRASLYDLTAHRPRAARAARAAHSPCASGWGRRAWSSRSTTGRCGTAVAAVAAAEVEAVAVCLLFAFLHPEHERRGRRGAARGVAGRARVALVRAAARVPGVRALLDHRGERVPGARAVGVPGGDRAAAARHAVLGRRGRCGHGGRPAGCVRPFRAGGRASSARRSSRAQAASRTCSPSTWAGRAPTSRPSSAARRR